VCGVGGVVLDPELADPETLGEAVGADQRGQSGLERVAGLRVEGKEVRVAPDAPRPRRDLPARLGGIERGEVITGLKRPEALLTDEARLERIGRAAFLATERFESQPFLFQKNLRLCDGGRRFRRNLFPHLPGLTTPAGIGTFLGASPGGLPGLHRASPSAPLDVVAM
jgi:hypothetical protein